MKYGKTWSIGKRVAGTCVVLVLLGSAVGAVSLVSSRKLRGQLTGVAQESLPKMQHLATLQAIGLEYRGTSLLLGTPGLSEKYQNSQVKHLGELEKQMKDSLDAIRAGAPEAELPKVNALEDATRDLVAAITHFRELSLHGQSQEAGAFWSESGGSKSKAFRKALEDMVRLEEQHASATVDAGLSTAQWAAVLGWTLLAMMIGIGAGLGTLTVRNVNRILHRSISEIRESIDQIASASGQVAIASHNLANRASQQAASLEETSASAQEISATTKRNAEVCDTVASLMRQTETQVADTDRRLEQTMASMHEINDSGERIAKITQMIDGIAFQTNILALNAAVEAARAGEAGLGFAVVANEVRNLAARCASAANDIKASIEESVNNSRTGKSRLDEAVGSVRVMSESAIRASGLVHEIDEAARQQNISISAIGKALLSIEESTQHTAAIAEESASASQELQSQAAAIGDSLKLLEALV